MPLVRISLRRGKSREYRQAVGDGIHRALVDVIGVPPKDRFQLIAEHDDENRIYDRSYLDVARSDDAVFVEISLRRGRPDGLKQAFYARVVENLAADPGLRPEDVAIVLTENGEADWSFGKGEAQMLGAGAPPIRTTVPA
ncbi:MAG TPA: tautomerase family protein [Reyranella sp.]|nr:tautomerase family protein [Reyranella sp.]